MEQYGYLINDGITTGSTVSISTEDELYFWNIGTSAYVWLAAPALEYCAYYIWNAGIHNNGYGSTMGVRPVICLNADIPARLGVITNYMI